MEPTHRGTRCGLSHQALTTKLFQEHQQLAIWLSRKQFEENEDLYIQQGLEQADFLSEGLIALYDASTRFDPSRSCTGGFASFAANSIRRRLITFRKQSSRHKHKCLNGSRRFESTLSDEQPWIPEIADSHAIDPAKLLMHDISSELKQLREKLSKTEFKVLKGRLEGKSYNEIARDLNCKLKRVDNAMSRIRAKATLILYGKPEAPS